MLLVPCLIALMATCDAWVLETNHQVVEIGETKSVNLTCSHGGKSSKEFGELVRMRIIRKAGNVAVAEAREGNPNVTHEKGIITTSKMFRKPYSSKSYLTVVWPVAGENTLGEYHCALDGFNMNEGTDSYETQPVTIAEKTVTVQDLLRMMKATKAESDSKHKALDMEIENLKDWIASEILNRTQELYENGSQVSMENQETLQRLQENLLKTDKQWREGDENIARKFSSLLNETVMDLQDEISSLNNYTVTEVSKIEEQDKDIMTKCTQLRNMIKSEYVTKQTFSSQIFNLTTSRDEMMKNLSEEITNVTVNEIAVLEQRCSDEHAQLYKAIYDLSNNSQDNCSKLLHNLNNVTNDIEFIDKKYQNITDDLLENGCGCLPTESPAITLESTERDITTVPTSATTIDVSEWPEGNYALVSPEAGCPHSNGFIWEEGWVQFHTATDFNEDLVSPKNHFKRPIFQNSGVDNFLKLHFCSKRELVANARRWPRGAYCLTRVNHQCPPGFRSTYIQYDGEHTHEQHRRFNFPDMEIITGSVDRIHYCCRQDADPNLPIHLPYAKPFYLFRYNDAECQKVSGMTVSSESIQIDTNHDENEDAFEDPDNHPAATLHPVKHTMCYYAPLPSQ